MHGQEAIAAARSRAALPFRNASRMVRFACVN